MIKEAYVSFEVAKLLKEKGFVTPCDWLYCSNGDFGHRNPLWDKEMFTAPTQQMAVRWLREEYEISIEVSALKRHRWVYTIYRLLEERVVEIWNDGTYVSYEDAVDAALKYCLENLNKLT